MIKSYLAAHPKTEDGLDMIGITMSASDWHWMITLGNPAGLIADASPDNGQWIIDDEYNVHYKHVTDEEKEYFKWLCRMYNEGILIRTLQRRQMMTILQSCQRPCCCHHRC